VVSATRVAEGAADLAAIDWVSWRLYRRCRPQAAHLRVLMLTDPTPGCPLIAAPGTDVGKHRHAVAAALAGLDAGTREDLAIMSFVPLEAEDYEMIRERFDAARARLRLWDQPVGV
jgi:ABC-type phosphate/phosphonate transport system substrate-binding protein